MPFTYIKIARVANVSKIEKVPRSQQSKVSRVARIPWDKRSIQGQGLLKNSSLIELDS